MIRIQPIFSKVSHYAKKEDNKDIWDTLCGLKVKDENCRPQDLTTALVCDACHYHILQNEKQ